MVIIQINNGALSKEIDEIYNSKNNRFLIVGFNYLLCHQLLEILIDIFLALLDNMTPNTLFKHS